MGSGAVTTHANDGRSVSDRRTIPEPAGASDSTQQSSGDGRDAGAGSRLLSALADGALTSRNVKEMVLSMTNFFGARTAKDIGE